MKIRNKLAISLFIIIPMIYYISLFNIITTKGFKYSISYCLKTDIRNQYKYNEAWDLFKKGNLSESKKIIYRLKSSDMIIANCHYLKGHILIYEAKPRLAILEFQKSIDYYEENSLYENLFYSYLGIAVAKMDLGEYSEFEKYMEKSLDNFRIHSINGEFTLDKVNLTFSQKTCLAEYYTIKKRYYLLVDDLDNAHLSAENSLIYYSLINNLNGKSNALSDLGFIAMLLGNYNDGFKYTLEANSIIVKLGNEKKKIYNNLNLIIYAQCNNLEYKYLVDEIDEWIVNYQDAHLKEYLDRILKLRCK